MLIGGFKYKGKEGGEMFLGKRYANERFTLMGGPIVVFLKYCIIHLLCILEI